MYTTNLTYAVMKYSPEELLNIAEAWRQEIKTTAGFKWERQPYRARMR